MEPRGFAPGFFMCAAYERQLGGQSLAQIAKGLSVCLIGWRGYFGFCQTPSVLRALDKWTRRRLRAMAWKQ
jgi:RNA-directed DNA polymerase